MAYTVHNINNNTNPTIIDNNTNSNMSEAQQDFMHLPLLEGKHVNVAMLTAGGLAPCLSSSIAHLMINWVKAL